MVASTVTPPTDKPTQVPANAPSTPNVIGSAIANATKCQPAARMRSRRSPASTPRSSRKSTSTPGNKATKSGSTTAAESPLAMRPITMPPINRTMLRPVTTSCTADFLDLPPSARLAITSATMMPGTSSSTTRAARYSSPRIPASRENFSAAVKVTAETEP